MNKQIEFIQDCIKVLQQVDPYEFDLRYEWKVDPKCGCVIGHLSHQPESREKYNLAFDEDYQNLISFDDSINHWGGRFFTFSHFEALLAGLGFDDQQRWDLHVILGYRDGDISVNELYEQIDIGYVEPQDVIEKLQLFAASHGFELEERDYKAFDAVKELLR